MQKRRGFGGKRTQTSRLPSLVITTISPGLDVTDELGTDDVEARQVSEAKSEGGPRAAPGPRGRTPRGIAHQPMSFFDVKATRE